MTGRDDYPDVVRQRAAICAEIWGIAPLELIAWAAVGMVLNAY